MKKILLASSALVLVGGAAFAEVVVGGSAEMGFIGGDLDNNIGESEDLDFQFWTDMEVDFTLSGETEGGVSFGAHIDLDDVAENGGIPSTTDGDFAVFISGDFGTLTMGDTDGAFDWAIQDTNFGMPGTINDNEEHLGYDGMAALDGFYDGQIARYDYSFGDFAFAVSAEIEDEPDSDNDIDDPVLGIGAKYTLDLASGSIAFGAGYQGVDDLYYAGLSAAATFGGLKAGLTYYAAEVSGVTIGLNDEGTNIEFDLDASTASSQNTTDVQYVGGSVAYTFDAITVGVNAGTYDADDDDFDKAWGAGITASYDLGGGLELQTGYGYSEAKTNLTDGEVDASVYTYSFGLAMSF